MNYITYCRVSTDKQGIRGLGMDAQLELVTRHATITNGKVIGAYVEVETGTNKVSRPQLAKALEHCRITGAVLLIAKLDRLARNVAFVSNLMEAGVDFVAADMPTANRLTIHIIAAMAEHEAKLISERTTAGLAAIKREIKETGSHVSRAGNVITSLGGFKGRRDLTNDERAQGTAKRVAKAQDRSKLVADRLCFVLAGCPEFTLGQLTNFLNANHFTAPRGGKWSKTQVLRIIKTHNLNVKGCNGQ